MSESADGWPVPGDEWVAESVPVESGWQRIRDLARSHPRAAGIAVVVVAVLVILVSEALSGGSKPRATTTTGTRTAPQSTTSSHTTTTTTTPTASVSPTTTLAPGSSGAQVRMLQQALRALGLFTGTADGAYGPKTQQAVAGFQRSVGLTPDGVFGRATLAKLAAAG